MANGLKQPGIKIANWQIFSALVFINLVIVWFVKEHVLRYEVLYHLFQEQLEITRLEHQVDLLRNWFNLNYLLVPLSLFLKLNLLAFILQFPLLFIMDDISYKKIFRVVMIAELAMIGCAIMQWVVLFFKPVDSVELESFARIPLSLAVLLQHYSHLSNPAKMIVNRFNVFDLLWCALVCYQLRTLTNMKHIDIVLLVAGVWIFLLIMQWLGAEIFLLLSV
jgi:hypothetical protein